METFKIFAFWLIAMILFACLIGAFADIVARETIMREKVQSEEKMKFASCKRTGYTAFSEIWTCPDGNVYKR